MSTNYDMMRLTGLLLNRICPTAPCAPYNQCVNAALNGEYCNTCLKTINTNTLLYTPEIEMVFHNLLDEGYTIKYARYIMHNVIKNPRKYMNSSRVGVLARVLHPKFKG